MEQFKVHNGSRDPLTRTTRAANAVHRGLKQYIPIGQQRVLRGRPVLVTAEQLKEHLLEMKGLVAAGLIYVTTLDERVVDLDTMKPEAPAAEPPLPHPPLDSAANDAVGGQEKLSSHLGEVPPPQDFQMPVPPPATAFEDPVTPHVPVIEATETVLDAVEGATAEPEGDYKSEMPSLTAPAPTPAKSEKKKR